MKRFEFPLESVLRLRRFHEAEARSALVAAIGARDEAAQALETTRHEARLLTRRLRDDLSSLHAEEVANAWREMDRLEQLALKQAAILADCEREVDVRQEAYVAAQQERKPLDRLREEMQREYVQTAEAAEQSRMDEVAMISFARRGLAP